MKVLTIPNWSFGRDRGLLRQFQEILDSADVAVHYCQGDIDHNRTVTAFSGEAEAVQTTLFALADVALPTIDLNRHVGVHPRIGALDVCPFFPLPDPPSIKSKRQFREWVEGIGEQLAVRFDLPVFLYEKSERGRHEADLPSLRKGGFGGLLDRDLEPDFGPRRAHPNLGATVLGWRDFLIAMNVNLKQTDADAALRIAKMIRDRRNDGEHEFLGVRALGFMLAAQEMSQVSLNLTLPDVTPVDPVLSFVREQAERLGAEVAWNELIGVIRDVDLPNASLLPARPEQVIVTRPERHPADASQA